MNTSTWIVLGVISAGLLRAGPSDWIPQRKQLRGLDVTGNVVLDIPLGGVRFGAAPPIPLLLTHTIELDADGTNYSSMQCMQLTTFVRPVAADELIWRLPNGANVKFAFNPREDVAVGSGYRCEKLPGNVLKIGAGSDWTYEYKAGNLESITTNGRSFICTTVGGRIMSIQDSSTRLPLLNARYTSGRLVQLQLPSYGHVILEYSDLDRCQVRAVRSVERGMMCQIDYKGGMIQHVNSAKKAYTYDWRVLHADGREKRILRTDDIYSYGYEIRDLFVMLSATSVDGKTERLRLPLINIR